MDISGMVTNDTRRVRTVLALTLVAVVVASVAVGTASAATINSGLSADSVEIGESGVSQTVEFSVDLNASESTTVTIETDTNTGLGSKSASVSDVVSATSSATDTTAGTPSLSNGDITFTLEETGGNPQTTDVTVELTVDASSQTTEALVMYIISETKGAEMVVGFNLEDTTTPTFDSAITGDSASGSSTARQNVTLSFVENGTGIDAATVDASDFSVAGATVTDASVTAPDEVTLGLSANLATDATPDVTLDGDISDTAGNTLAGSSSSVTKTATDGLAPRQTGWAYDDGDADGTVDLVRIDFSEDVSASTFDAGNWSVTNPGDPNLSDPATPNLPGTTRLYLNVSADADVTGVQTGSVDTPTVQYSGTNIVDAAGNQAAAQGGSYTDVADPVFKSAEYLDVDGDGQLDRIDVTFTELISNSQSTADASDFSLGGPSIGDITKGSLTVPGDGPTVQLGITGVADETSRTIVVGYSGSGLKRNGANEVRTFSSETVADGAAPLVTGATTLDRDGDGNVDAANLTFTEALSDATVTASEFSLDGTAADAFDTLSTADDDTLQIRITTDGNEVSGTGAVDVTHTPGTTADAAGNTLGTVAAGDVSETDGAAPVVSGFSLTADDANDELDVSFDASESLSAVSVSITGPESATLSSFSTSGSTYTASSGVSTDGDYTATLDTADDAAGNSAASTPSATVTVSFVTTPTPTPVPTAEPSTRSGGGNIAPSALSGTASKVRVSGSTGLSEVGVNFGSAAGGTIRATAVNALGGNAPPGTFVTAADITVPDSFTGTASTLKFAISRDRLAELGVDASALTVYRLHDGSWEALETRVVDRGDDRIVVEADTPGFSRFAVMAGETTGSTSTATTSSGAKDGTSTSDDAAAGGERSDSEETEDAGDTQLETGSTAAETTASQTPGFGVGVALVSLLAFLVVARRQLD